MLMINKQFLAHAIGEHEYSQLLPYARLAQQQLLEGSGVGNEFHGWVRLPQSLDRGLLDEIQRCGEHIRTTFDAFVCVGIGGSYLGHKAIIEALHPPFNKPQPEILYAAWNLSPHFLDALMRHLQDKNYCINVIAKEGIALETAVTFRILRHALEQRFGKEGARERIFITTDKFRGPLKEIVDKENYPLFHLPHEVGGRFSVLTPVGLLPMAVAGLDIHAFMDGAAEMMSICHADSGLENPALCYAMTRDILMKKGMQIELFVNDEPAMTWFAEWLKQLFGESEGKDGKGLFPASVLYSTDLHSLGQWVQEGRRNVFETVLAVQSCPVDVAIPAREDDLDRLQFLAGSSLGHIQRAIRKASLTAHSEGGAPGIEIQIAQLDERHFGALMYFFMMSVAISGYLLGINPFDQNGVDRYKSEMMQLLKKQD
ncbi:glucose-6-phosphate isomerase [Escherichia fergusonii]|nr:glucose-6-phosphate isomerase [Escherichia fergusonii]